MRADICLWHKADIPIIDANVRFQPQQRVTIIKSFGLRNSALTPRSADGVGTGVWRTGRRCYDHYCDQAKLVPLSLVRRAPAQAGVRRNLRR
jgi:hypothetical protein